MEEYLSKCQMKTEPIYGKIVDLFNITENKQCLLKTREVIQDLKHRTDLACCDVILGSLSHLFFQNSRSGSRIAVRRLLSSFFKSLSSEAKIILSLNFEILILTKTNEPMLTDSPCKDVRQAVDILASLLENFAIGVECVSNCVIPYTGYLVAAHKHFMRFTKRAESPVELNEAMHHCLVTEQLINRMLQKCFNNLQEKLKTNDNNIKDVLQNLIATNVEILIHDDMMMDCRCNAGITLTLMLRLCCADQLELLLLTLLRNNVTPVSIPEWMKSTDIMNLTKSTLSTSSYLCFLYGIMSMLTSHELTFEFDKNSFILTDLFLTETLDLVPVVLKPAGKVILAKVVNLWTEKALVLTDVSLNPKLKLKLVGESDEFKSVLDYIWNALDDSLDAVRQNARLAFDYILKAHLKSRCPTSLLDTFISKTVQDVFEMPWCKRGKYALLSCLVGNFGACRMLEWYNDLTRHVLLQLEDHTLASCCSEFYEKLYVSHKSELAPENISEWYTIWVNPIVELLCTDSKNTKNHIMQQLLPSLMSRSNDILKYMIQYLSQKDTQSRGTLGALIMCLRRGRSLGMLDDKKSDFQTWCGIVHIDVLKYALSALDEQIRLDAFSLLCENKKTTNPIQLVEFELMKLFIPQNLNNQSPSFRQQISAYMKKFLVRLKDSENSLIRKAEKVTNEQDKQIIQSCLMDYNKFLIWLQNHLFSSLYPGAAFAMRTSCLRMLSCMVTILQSPSTNKQSFSFYSDFGKPHIHTLLECISDSFEENKIEALRIWNGYLETMTNPILKEEQLTELFETCVDLSVSTRPQDSTSSAFLARCLLQMDGVEQIIQRHKLDLKVLPISKITCSVDDNEPWYTYLTFLEVMILSLQDQTEVAKRGLIIAAANRPIYPTIHCIRYVLGDVDLKLCSKSKAWKDIFSKLINICLEVAKVVSPVVQDSSPEGNVPAEAMRGPGLNMGAIAHTDDDKKLLLEAEECEKTVTLMPEYLVVCCWRSIKEVSLLLGEITLKASIDDPAGNQGLLTYEQILEIGDHFITQLLQSKHKGAFELAYTGFVMMCERLWKSCVLKLHQLPVEWLNQLLIDITNDDGNAGLCSTRRSAGIPFYVKALLVTEPIPNEQKCFTKAMKRLLELAVIDKSTSTTNNPPKVHALNILKVLFKDNKLGDFVTPYLSDGLIAAILGFKSEYWSVRNSSTLLLSSLIVRIFGVKVSKNDSDLSRKNCLTGRAFFQRFPKLYSFLLTEFEAATANSLSKDVTHLHPSLYPVLMVLGRLFPSAMEGTDTNVNLAAFIPLIIRCSGSPVFKTRVMAARAIQPLVEKDQLSTIFVQLFQLLPKFKDIETSYNHIHGVLLQIKFLLDSVLELSMSLKRNIGECVIAIIMEYTWLLTQSNKCPFALETAFEVVDRVICLKMNYTGELNLCPLYKCYIQRLNEAVGSLVTAQPGSVNCHATIATLALKYLLHTNAFQDAQLVRNGNSVILRLLQSNSYEVRLSVLDQMCHILSNSETDQHNLNLIINDKNIFTTLLTMALTQEWHFECLGKLFDVLSCILLKSDCDGQNQCNVNQTDVFKTCLAKLESERRDGVKCCILKFISRYVGYIYHKAEKAEKYLLLKSWLQKLAELCTTEQDADLQVAVAQSILDNAEILLLDPDDVLKAGSLEFWKILFDLLQEDDLDVKEVVSKTLSVLEPSLMGDVQPACSLEKLLEKFISAHISRKPVQVSSTLLIMLQGEEEGDFEEERLFDIGEMNTYRDDLYFLKLIGLHLSRTLQTVNMWNNGGAQDSCNASNTHASSEIKTLFDAVAQILCDRLVKCQTWSLPALVKDNSSHSRTVTELSRSLIFLHCSKVVPFQYESKLISDLRTQTLMCLDKSSINCCLTDLRLFC